MKKGLVCPACKAKLSVAKNYDHAYQWFECGRCEGCFTYDEILEGGGAAVEEVAEEEAPKAAVKKKTAEPEPEKPRGYYHGEISTKEVVNIIADEIQLIYEESHLPTLNDMSAQDKALQLVRVLRMDGKVRITEGKVKHVLCEDHSV